MKGYNDLDTTQEIMALSVPETPLILIVDDERDSATLIARMAKTSGFDSVCVTSGEDALVYLENAFVPIVLIDRMMPGMSGIELIEKIRSHPWPGYVYTVMCSFANWERDVETGLEAGADDYIGKDVSQRHFAARLRCAMRVVGLEHSLKSAIEYKRMMSLTDQLTNLYNRRYAAKTLGAEIARVQRDGAHFGVLLLDIDHFKRVNDVYGHEVGDMVLVKVAEVLRSFARAGDWVARMGGEEFLVVLHNTPLDGSWVFAERLRSKIESTPIQVPPHFSLVKVTASIGVTHSSLTADLSSLTVTQLITDADDLMYTSKSSGRNRVTAPETVRG